MKKIVVAIFFFVVYTNSIYSVNTVSDYSRVENYIIHQYSNNQDGTMYKYGEQKIDKGKYIRNLDYNVQSYLSYQNWIYYWQEEFQKAFAKFMTALKENRLSADSFGAITDSKGELCNVDEDDYWYDNRGNRITGEEYRALSEHKQKKYRAFYSHREVVGYFNEVAKAIANENR